MSARCGVGPVCVAMVSWALGAELWVGHCGEGGDTPSQRAAPGSARNTPQLLRPS